MRKALKKILLFLTSASISASFITIGYADKTEDKPSYDENAQYIEILKETGILIGDESGYLNLEHVLTRSELAVLIYRMHNFSGETDMDTAVAYVRGQGFMTGDEKGNFHPNDNVTYIEAVTAVIKTMGYKITAERSGGYPTGYMNTASSLKILKNLEGLSQDTPVARGYAARLIFNAMRADLPESYFDAEMNILPEEGRTMFSIYYDIFEFSGQINANEHTVLYGDVTPKENEAAVSGVLYNAGDTDISDYLGYYVDYFYRYDDKTGESTILAYNLTENKNYALKIMSEDIESVDSSYITYYDGDKLKKEKNTISTFVYNGKVENIDYNLMIPEEGSITLLGTSKGSYSYAFVEAIDTYVVSRAVLTENMIIDKLGKAPLKVDFEKDDVYMRFYDDPNLKIELDALRENDILSIVKSRDGDYTKITVYRDYSYTGIISGIDEEGKYIIDGYSIEVGKDFAAAVKNNNENAIDVELNKQYKIYLNESNKIAYIEKYAEDSKGYGFLLNMWQDEDDEDVVKARIYNSVGRLEEIQLAKKVKFNTVAGKEPSDVLSGVGGQGNVAQQLVYYEKNNDGLLRALETAATGQSDDRFSIDYDCEMDVNKRLTFYGNTFGHRYTVSSNGVIFWKNPADANQKLSERDFKIVTLNDINGQTKYYADVYDSNLMGEANVIVITQEVYSELEELTAGYMVIETVNKAVNSDEEVLYRITGGTMDGQLSLFVNDNAEIAVQAPEHVINQRIPYKYYDRISDVADLRPGDIIRYNTDAYGQIDLYAPMFLSPTGHPELTYEDDAYIDTESNHYAAGWTSYCHMYDCSANFISFKSTRVADPGSLTEKVNSVYKRDTRTPIYLYDSSDKSVTKISYDDIITLKQAEAAADNMVIRVYQGSVRFVVIYR